MRTFQIGKKSALLPVSIATGLSLLGDSALYTVLPTKSAEAGVALATIGILLSVNRFIRLFLNGPIGILADRWSRRSIFIPAIFLGALTTAIYAVSQGFWGLFIGRLLWGVAWSGIWVSGNATVLDLSERSTRGKSVGVYQIAFYVGAASGALFGGVLTDWLGYRLAMLVASMISLVGAFIALLFLPETKKPQAMLAKSQKQERLESSFKLNRSQLVSATGWYATNRLVIAGVFIATFGLLVAHYSGEGLAISDRTTIGVTTLTGVGLGFTTLFSMVAAPLAGNLSDRFGARWGIGAVGLAIGIMGLIALSLGYPALIFVALPLVSYSSGSNQGLSTALVGDISPRAIHGKRLGVLFTAGDLASAIGPPAAYALIPIIGIASVYRLSAGIMVGMLGVAIYWAFQQNIPKL